jgi:hypothetical protein
VLKGWELELEEEYPDYQRKVNAMLDYSLFEYYLNTELRKKETSRKQ